MSFLWYLSIFSQIWLNITSHSSLLRKLRERVCHPNVTKLLFCSLSFKWSRKSSPWYLLRKSSVKIFWTTVSTRWIKIKKSELILTNPPLLTRLVHRSTNFKKLSLLNSSVLFIFNVTRNKRISFAPKFLEFSQRPLYSFVNANIIYPAT